MGGGGGRGQPEGKAQVKGPQVKFICIKGLKSHLHVLYIATAAKFMNVQFR
jgi:hypothetical protein